MNDLTPTGSIQRAKAVLDVLADHPEGASLSQVIAGTDFTSTTTHRTLQSLQTVNYVYQDPETRRYCLGGALGALARHAQASSVIAQCRRAMRRVADASEDTVFLSIPEGAVSFCAHVELGAFPIRTLSLSAGDRVPLGVGATGQALYAASPKRRRTAAAEANAGWMADYNYTPDRAEEMAADFAARGYALNPSIPIPGMSAVALPVMTANGTLVCAMGIGAINERMSVERIEGLLIPALRTEVDQLSRKFTRLEQEGLL